jgi:hypothetical protein
VAAAAVPEHVWDLAIGAAAGAAAVLVSMPFDCVKTYMQTHTVTPLSVGMMAGGVAGKAGAVAVNPFLLFLATGAYMVRSLCVTPAETDFPGLLERDGEFCGFL